VGEHVDQRPSPGELPFAGLHGRRQQGLLTLDTLGQQACSHRDDRGADQRIDDPFRLQRQIEHAVTHHLRGDPDHHTEHPGAERPDPPQHRGALHDQQEQEQVVSRGWSEGVEQDEGRHQHPVDGQ